MGLSERRFLRGYTLPDGVSPAEVVAADRALIDSEEGFVGRSGRANSGPFRVGQRYRRGGDSPKRPVRVYTVRRIVNAWTVECHVDPPLHDGSSYATVAQGYLTKGERL